MRQEIDGSQAEQLEFVPCGGTGAREKLSPAQIRDKRDHTFLILKVKGTFPTTLAQKGSLEVKREGGCHPIVGDVNLPIGLFSRIHLG